MGATKELNKMESFYKKDCRAKKLLAKQKNNCFRQDHLLQITFSLPGMEKAHWQITSPMLVRKFLTDG